MRAVGLLLLVCAGCGDDDPCAACTDPGSRLVDAITSASLLTAPGCGPAPPASSGAPTLSQAPRHAACPVVTPGGQVTLSLVWSGAAAARFHLTCGGCRSLTISSPTGGFAGGLVNAQLAVDAHVCDALPKACHPLECQVWAETATGAVSIAITKPVLLDCVGGTCLGDDAWVHTDAGWVLGNGAADPACAPQPGPDLLLPAGGVTGAPCSDAKGCLGASPFCIRTDGLGTVWPDGYCTSACNPAQSDADGVNAACPGIGVCVGSGANGFCELPCTAAGGARPCPRAGYACFQGCEPTALSQCVPTDALSCNSDGSLTCGPAGLDAVGVCAPRCDPFAQDCKLGQPCYASPLTGVGACVEQIGIGHVDGAHCDYFNNCSPGYGCALTAMGYTACGRYCGGPNNVACPNGQTCRDLSPSVGAQTVGVCIP